MSGRPCFRLARPDALEAIGRESFDLLVSDIGLPGMDGYALVGHLRRDSGNPSNTIPAIAVTAFARENRQRAISAGYDAHLAKPITPHELTQLSRNWWPPTGSSPGNESSLVVVAPPFLDDRWRLVRARRGTVLTVGRVAR